MNNFSVPRLLLKLLPLCRWCRMPSTNCLIKDASGCATVNCLFENASNLLWTFNLQHKLQPWPVPGPPAACQRESQHDPNKLLLPPCRNQETFSQCVQLAPCCTVASHQHFLYSTGLSAMTFISVADYGSCRVQWHRKPRKKSNLRNAEDLILFGGSYIYYMVQNGTKL